MPAILLAHGFGGTKRSVNTQAQDLAGQGYAVLTWTAQGFGLSGGQIHLDSPDYEVRDAQRLIDWLAQRPEIRQDAPGDPRVAAVGGSYGGGLALMLAGADPRVDAIVPMITWNDLANAFLPDAAGQGPANGVFKKQWAGLFFGTAAGGALASLASLAPQVGNGGSGGTGDPGGGPGDAVPGSRSAPGMSIDPQCGRFARDVCAAYLQLATSGRPDATTLALLHRSSPATVLSHIKAPTLLIQGQADSLFPLTEARGELPGHRRHRHAGADGLVHRRARRRRRAAGRPGPHQVPDHHLAQLLPAGRGRQPRHGVHLLPAVRIRRRHPPDHHLGLLQRSSARRARAARRR